MLLCSNVLLSWKPSWESKLVKLWWSGCQDQEISMYRTIESLEGHPAIYLYFNQETSGFSPRHKKIQKIIPSKSLEWVPRYNPSDIQEFSQLGPDELRSAGIFERRQDYFRLDFGEALHSWSLVCCPYTRSSHIPPTRIQCHLFKAKR